MAQRRWRRQGTGGGRLRVVACLVACALGALAWLIGRSATVPHPGVARAHSVASPLPIAAAGMAFAPGACVAYAPLGEDRHRTVFIDPGHGGPDPGASGTTGAGVPVLEKVLTLGTAQALLGLLRGRGYRVVLARTSDTSVARLSLDDVSSGTLSLTGEHQDTLARIACGNAARADVLLALHFNAFGDPTVGGAETLYDRARPFRAASERLATLVQAQVVASLAAGGWTIANRGVMDDLASGTPALTNEAAAYGHLLELGPAAPGWLAEPSAMPGVLCEPLFVTDPGEAEVARSAAGQRAIAQGLARAVDLFLAPAPPTRAPTYYPHTSEGSDRP